MAPYVPEEVDVFTVPHSRMKELVNDYFQRLEKTNFCNDVDLQGLLESLQHTFVEFKHHERIENTLIMKKLKIKLKELSVRNQAVCNCHKDSHLTDMLQLVSDGYRKKTVQDRINYGLQLRAALEEFTEDFLPHMRQEEEVFQPLLLEYFSYEELCELKNKVIDRHFHCEPEESIEKFLTEDAEREASDTDDEELCQEPETSINDLPAELTSKIFSFLDPRDLARCAQVCQDWSELAYDPLLWKHMHPVKWAQGNWNYRFDPEDATCDDDDDSSGGEEENYVLIDEDADIDESADSEDDIADIQLLRREARILVDIAKYVLPRVGTAVQTLDLGQSRAITSGMLNKLLRQCPNIEVLNLTNTRISDTGLKSLGRNGVGSNLKWVHLGGCANVTDATLMRLALALSQADLPNPEQTACNNQCGVSVTEQSCLCEEVRNMEKTLAQLKVENMQSSWTANSSGYPERHVKIHLDKNAMDYSNQRARDKNRRSDCEINGMCCMNETKEPNNSCHAGCHTGGAVESAIEECAGHQRKSRGTSGGCKTNQTQTCDKNSVSLTDWKKQSQTHFVRTLSYLNLSGCYQITDVGLRALRGAGPLSRLEQLELSGCPSISGEALTSFVDACPALPGEQLAYCDNIVDGPYADCANGCQNICTARYCCRSGK